MKINTLAPPVPVHSLFNGTPDTPGRKEDARGCIHVLSARERDVSHGAVCSYVFCNSLFPFVDTRNLPFIKTTANRCCNVAVWQLTKEHPPLLAASAFSLKTQGGTAGAGDAQLPC